jgi:hypothetical protein
MGYYLRRFAQMSHKNICGEKQYDAYMWTLYV